jgi:hypothetical protein
MSAFLNQKLGQKPGSTNTPMSDLHEARDPRREPQIDTVGWLFLAFAVAITAAAAMVSYKANDTMVANAPVSHVVAR